MPQVIATFVVSGLGLTGTAAALTTALIQLGAGLLLSEQMARRQGRGGEPQDGRVLFTRAVGDRIKRYGRVLVAGQIVFGRSGGAGSDPADGVASIDPTENKVLHRIIVHGHGEANAILQYRLDGRRRRVEPDGRVLADQYRHNLGGSLLRVRSRLGTVPAVPYEGPVDAAADWGAAHRLDGLVTTYIRCEQRDGADGQQESYPSGATELQVLGEFSRVYDPRVDAVVYTDNAALVIADWIEGVDGFGATGALYRPDLIAAADRADALRPQVSGGSLPTWRLAGSASMAEAPEGPLRQMLDACAGDLRVRPDGTWSLNIGPDPAPVVTLGEADLVELLEIDDGPDGMDRYTTLPATYVDEALDYAETTMDPWVNTAELARIGAELVGPSLDLSWAPTHAQARHAAKIRAQRDNAPRRAKVQFRISALPAIYERTVRLDLPGFGLSGVFRVAPFSLSLADMTVTLELKQIDPAAQGWSLAEEGAPLALPPEAADPDRPPSPPTGVQAFGNGTAGNAGVLVAFDPPADADTQHYVAISAAGANVWSAVTVASGATTARAGSLVAGGLYDVAVIAARSATSNPDNSDATAQVIRNVTARADDAAPLAPSALSVTDAGGGVAVVRVTAPGDAQLRQIEVLRGVEVVAMVRALPGAVVELADAAGPGRRVWTARGVSLSGARGPATAEIEATITT